jgi:peptide/nickel transport system permease protein
MAKYIVKRVLMFIPMALLMSFLIFGGIELAPGDYVSSMISPEMAAEMTPEQLETIRQAYGLDDPFVVRYAKWLVQVLKGNWGYSLSNGVAVKEIIMQKLPVTLELALTGLLISAVLGSIFGVDPDSCGRYRPFDSAVLLRYGSYSCICIKFENSSGWRADDTGYGTLV